MLPVISSSFHGRDIFSPMAAHLAERRRRSSRSARPSPSTSLVRLPAVAGRRCARASSRPRSSTSSSSATSRSPGRPPISRRPSDRSTRAAPLVIDFPAHAGAPAVRGAARSGSGRSGGVPVGASLLMADSEGHLSLADNQGDAAGRLGLTLDRPVASAPPDRAMSDRPTRPARRGRRADLPLPPCDRAGHPGRLADRPARRDRARRRSVGLRQEHAHPGDQRAHPARLSRASSAASSAWTGAPTTELKLRDIARTVGTVLQDPAKQIVGATVEAELAFGPENLGMPRDEMRDRMRRGRASAPGSSRSSDARRRPCRAASASSWPWPGS